MLRSAALISLALLSAVHLTSADTCYIYEKAKRSEAVCEQEETLTGIYTKGSYADLERQTASQDIYIAYLTQGGKFPSDFVTLCNIKDKLPLIILRPTDYSTDYINELAARLAGYNMPMLLEIDSSLSDKYKDFYRSCADIIHLKAPSVGMVWGISDYNIDNISTLYPGDNYVDWVALNMFEGADRQGIISDPYPAYHILSYFEKSKPIMINLSVASYTNDGHKYFAYEAAEEIKYIYSLSAQSSAIKAVNYISKTTSKGSSDIKNSHIALEALKSGSTSCTHTNNIRIPLVAYKYNGSMYCEKGIIPTYDEYYIINNKRCYKIANAGRYVFVETI